jgi:hypothetical protein
MVPARKITRPLVVEDRDKICIGEFGRCSPRSISDGGPEMAR